VCGKAACTVRRGGSWKRGHGLGTAAPAAKCVDSAGSIRPPRQLSTLPARGAAGRPAVPCMLGVSSEMLRMGAERRDRPSVPGSERPSGSEAVTSCPFELEQLPGPLSPYPQGWAVMGRSERAWRNNAA